MLFLYLNEERKKKQAINAMCSMFVHETCVSVDDCISSNVWSIKFLNVLVFFFFLAVKTLSSDTYGVSVRERQLYIRLKMYQLQLFPYY